jgi:hypothetical protein
MSTSASTLAATPAPPAREARWAQDARAAVLTIAAVIVAAVLVAMLFPYQLPTQLPYQPPPSVVAELPDSGIPPVGVIWFGRSYDFETLGVVERLDSIMRLSDPISMVGHLDRSLSVGEHVLLVADGVSTPVKNLGGNDVVVVRVNPLDYAYGFHQFEISDLDGNIMADGVLTLT